MIIACFTNRFSNAIASGLWQYDYGQSLRIQGLSLPAAVEVHFSLRETGGEAVTRVGVTRDGVTDVIVPDSMLEGDGSVRDYKIYAFIYLADTESGETTHKIVMPVKARPRPEAFNTPEDAELFRDAIAAVNEAVESAKERVTPSIGENGNWFVDGEDTGKPSTGEKGDTGAVGPRGATGPQGEKGDKGDAGAQGPQGIQGEAGPKGDKGDTGAQGPKGDKGDKGEPGTDGRDGVGSWNDLEDKPFYEEGDLVELLPETQLVYDEDSGGYRITGSSIDVTTGEQYTVIWDGEEYTCIAVNTDIDDVMIPLLGNTIVMEGDNTGEPFAIMVVPPEMVESTGGIAALIYAINFVDGVPEADAGDHTLAIFAGGKVIHHLEPKYIKDMYYAEEFEKEVEILSAVSFRMAYKSDKQLGLIPGNTYYIRMNGEEYACVAKVVTYDTDTLYYLGNLALTNSGNDSGEPFLISDNDSGFSIAAFVYKEDGYIDSTATSTISVLHLVKEEKVHPIPGKYIDVKNLGLEWNPTHGEEYCVAEERSIKENNTYIEEVKYKSITSDQHLIVYFDGVRYDLKLFDWGGYFTAQTGDDVPFLVNVSNYGVKIHGMDTSTEHTIALYLYKYDQLPARYTHRYVDALPERGEEVDDVLCEADNAGTIAHLGTDGHVLMYNYSDDGMSKIGYINRSGYHFREYVGAVLRDCTAAMFSADNVSVGQHLEVESVNNGLVIFKAVDANYATQDWVKEQLGVIENGTY